MTFPVLGGNGAVASYQIDNSLRFNDDDSPLLDNVLGTPTNNKIYTYSFWLKILASVVMCYFLYFGDSRF